ncbi:hypothetical protein [Bradyrhizobium sp. AUGA SZCCT0160]|uniref:hypothetical protein n=1 Tax=Bradyrhizobium sp. AUGA SZCCT0160 TaxID=2807662 RepID=UPI001BA85D21|nr:hypothetical protein [Bradyrhizobium sp. AUGA SZCCT0160]MBR1194279.1 hypothetical protein [Bradyrhizobium sp. AUGA SZCCT0160]
MVISSLAAPGLVAPANPAPTKPIDNNPLSEMHSATTIKHRTTSAAAVRLGAMRAHDPLWDIGYNASCNFHCVINERHHVMLQCSRTACCILFGENMTIQIFSFSFRART